MRGYDHVPHGPVRRRLAWSLMSVVPSSGYRGWELPNHQATLIPSESRPGFCAACVQRWLTTSAVTWQPPFVDARTFGGPRFAFHLSASCHGAGR